MYQYVPHPSQTQNIQSLTPVSSESSLSNQLSLIMSRLDTIDEQQQHLTFSQNIVIAQSMDPWDRIELSSKATNPHLTNIVKNFYGITKKFYCQVVGDVKEDSDQKKINQPTVKNAHIWPQHTKGLGLHLFNLSLDDQDSPRNMMRLHFAIEAAFDVKRLCFAGFLPSSSSHPAFSPQPAPLVPSLSPTSTQTSGNSQRPVFGLRVRLLDPSLGQEKIGKTGKVFADIDGVEIKFFNEHRPFFRLLYAQHRRSLIVAERKGWIEVGEDDGQRASDQELLKHSVDSYYSNRISTWLGSRPGAHSKDPATFTFETASPPSDSVPETDPTLNPSLENKNSPIVIPQEEEKTCVGAKCAKLRYGKCSKKMCAICCKAAAGGLCHEHKRKK